MKLLFDVTYKNQPDPFIFEDNGIYYLYVTAYDGVELYSATDVFGVWHYEGIAASFDGATEYWAPSVIKYDDKYYIYVSCHIPGKSQYMHVAVSNSPKGPFVNDKILYDKFSIDSHIVQTDEGLFLWLAMDNEPDNERIGTRIFVQKFADPYTPVEEPKEVVKPSFDEERFGDSVRVINGITKPWHTIEGPFWFKEGDWQYVMYSGGCYENESYHIGYAVAKSTEQDLTKIDFIKHTDCGDFAPVMIKNDVEEGTGHHSVIKINNQYYAVYHGRDYSDNVSDNYSEARTARICKLDVKDGIITAQRYKDKI